MLCAVGSLYKDITVRFSEKSLLLEEKVAERKRGRMW